MKTNSYSKLTKMKKKLLYLASALALTTISTNFFAQAPTLGTAAEYVLFSTDGAVNITGPSILTGNLGTNNGTTTTFENVNGVINDANLASAQCAADLLIAYNQLNATPPNYFISQLLGNGDTLINGVYSISQAATIDLNLYLDAENDTNAVFVILINGSLSPAAGSKIKLINGAKACNVYWKIEGMLSVAAGSSMKGTFVVNNASIELNTNDTLDGRLLTTAGAITVDGSLAYTPTGCGSPILNGPTPPALETTACYTLFSANGNVTNTGVSFVTGDIGSNVGSAIGFDSLNVTGTIHPINDASTAACASDLLDVYNYLNALPYDIELLQPTKFGKNLVLTPHTYLINAATIFTDSVFLNAKGNADAVFVIKIVGAFSTSTYAKVILINAAQAKNVYWLITGAVEINEFSTFKGTIIVNNGAIDLKSNVSLEGRALTIDGVVTSAAITANGTMIPGTCSPLGINSFDETVDFINIYPNPFNASATFTINNQSKINIAELIIYNVFGNEVIRTKITKQANTINTSNLAAGFYFYKITSNNKLIQTGKLISNN
ncbi:MAG: hypothetical protein CO022_08175 [Flavobacteriales bacterium CG_4_9_14_0_2_um_filter_32_27]|nr:MAG: hypothetical protein CO022_08175 [Flavobacteriales bacterium CG_4_9_14_0_2_um_filter_32_27]